MLGGIARPTTMPMVKSSHESVLPRLPILAQRRSTKARTAMTAPATPSTMNFL